MTGERRRLVRVLVSLDAAAGEVLEVGAGLAARLDAELEALLVEASDLLRAMSHPASLHVPYGGGAPPGLAEVEDAIHVAVDRIRRELARAAERERLRWSMRIVGEDVAGEVAPARGGVLVLDRAAARALRAREDLASPRRERPVPLPGPAPRRAPLARRLWVLWDGSAPAHDALDVAVRLAGGATDGPGLLVAADDLREAERLAAAAPSPSRVGAARWRWAGGARPGDVARALPADAVLVAASESPAAGGARGVERLLRDAPGPVLVVG